MFAFIFASLMTFSFMQSFRFRGHSILFLQLQALFVSLSLFEFSSILHYNFLLPFLCFLYSNNWFLLCSCLWFFEIAVLVKMFLNQIYELSTNVRCQLAPRRVKPNKLSLLFFFLSLFQCIWFFGCSRFFWVHYCSQYWLSRIGFCC